MGQQWCSHSCHGWSKVVYDVKKAHSGKCHMWQPLRLTPSASGCCIQSRLTPRLPRDGSPSSPAPSHSQLNISTTTDFLIMFLLHKESHGTSDKLRVFLHNLLYSSSKDLVRSFRHGIAFVLQPVGLPLLVLIGQSSYRRL